MPCKRLLCSALLAAAPLAMALPDVAAQYSFSHLDVDRDDRISVDEAKRSPHLSANFATVDLNGDGFIDRAEFAREIAFVAVRPQRG